MNLELKLKSHNCKSCNNEFLIWKHQKAFRNRESISLLFFILIFEKMENILMGKNNCIRVQQNLHHSHCVLYPLKGKQALERIKKGSN